MLESLPLLLWELLYYSFVIGAEVARAVVRMEDEMRLRKGDMRPELVSGA